MGDEQTAAVAGAAAPIGEPVGVTDGPVEQLRIVEALLFAAPTPLSEQDLADRLPRGADVRSLLLTLQAFYASRGVNLVRAAGRWTFRTAADLSFLLHRERPEERKLSRAALETLAIVAYHQPVTRAEIEEVRGVTVAKGTLDLLLETGWVRIRGRRKTPGRPVTFGTTPAFLEHFGLDAITDLPGLDELKAAGLLDGRVPPGFKIPMPSDDPALREDEEPDDGALLDFSLAPEPERGSDA
jgi:segregation and condensation protein B